MTQRDLDKAMKKAMKFANAPMTSAEAAEFLRVSRSKFYEEIVPHLPWVEIGGRRLYTKQDLEWYMQLNRFDPPAEHVTSMKVDMEPVPVFDPADFKMSIEIPKHWGSDK